MEKRAISIPKNEKENLGFPNLKLRLFSNTHLHTLYAIRSYICNSELLYILIKKCNLRGHKEGYVPQNQDGYIPH